MNRDFAFSFRLVFVLGLTIMIAVPSSVHGQKPQPSREQTTFSEQDPIQELVALPRGVLGILLRTKEVRDELRVASDLERRNPVQLFRASEVHLEGSDEVDLVVAGVVPMSGADNDWYWVVLSPHTNPRIVLFAGCNTLELLGAKTNGYRNIRTSWSSASQTVVRSYRFDGKEYKLWKEKSSKNRY